MNKGLHRLVLDQACRLEDVLQALEDFVRDASFGNANRFERMHGEFVLCTLALERGLDALDPAARRGGDKAEDAFREMSCIVVRAFDAMERCAKSVVDEMRRLKVPGDRFLRDLSRIVKEGCADMVVALSSFESRPAGANERILRAKKAHREVARLYRQATANMLRHPGVVESLKTRAIYRHLYEAADRAEAAAEAVADMIVREQASHSAKGMIHV